MLTVISFVLGYDNRPADIPYWDRDDIFYPYHSDCRLSIDLEGTISESSERYRLSLKLFPGLGEHMDVGDAVSLLELDNIELSPIPDTLCLLRKRFTTTLKEPIDLESYIGVLYCDGKEVGRATLCLSPIPKDPSRLFKVVRGQCEVGLVGEDRSVPLRFKLTINSLLPYMAQMALGMHWYGSGVQREVPRSGVHKGRDYQIVQLSPDTDVEVTFEYVTSYTELLQNPEFAFLLVLADDDLFWIYQHMTIESLFDGFDPILDFSCFQLDSRYQGSYTPLLSSQQDMPSCFGARPLSERGAVGSAGLYKRLFVPDTLLDYLEYLEKQRYFDESRQRQGMEVLSIHNHYVFAGKRGVGKMSAGKELYQRLKLIDGQLGRFVKVDAMELLDSTNGFSPKLEEYIDMHSYDFIYIENAESFMLKGTIGSLNGIEVLANKLAISPHVRVVLSGRNGPLSELVNMYELARGLFKHFYVFQDIAPARSEERRVGQEC